MRGTECLWMVPTTSVYVDVRYLKSQIIAAMQAARYRQEESSGWAHNEREADKFGDTCICDEVQD